MKLYNGIILIMFGLTGVLLSGCNDGDQPSAKEKQLNSISGTWKISSASLDGQDVTADFAGFEVTFSGAPDADLFTYGVKGRPDLSPWPAGGTWSFGSDLKSTLVRDPGTSDELLIDYSITGSQLTMEFFFQGTGFKAGRVAGTDGNWAFTFTKK